MSNRRFSFLLTHALFPVALAFTALAADPPAPLNVIYTGRTLGYLRFPDTQTQAFTACDPGAKMSDGAKAVFDRLPAPDERGSTLLLGTGDNFAPELEARAFAPGPPNPPGLSPSKDLFTWDYMATPHQWVRDDMVSAPLAADLANGNGTIPADNVACFFKYAAYDALVPGKYDFYFGPERLRMLARFLETTDKQNPAFHPVHMLAANLSIGTTQPAAYPRIPSYQLQETLERRFDALHLPSSARYSIFIAPHAEKPLVSADLPDIVLPWMRKFTVHNAFRVSLAGTPVNFFDYDDPVLGVGQMTRPVHVLAAGAQVTIKPKLSTAPGTALNVEPAFDDARLCPANAPAPGMPRDPNDLTIGPNCIALTEVPNDPMDQPSKANGDVTLMPAVPGDSPVRDVLAPNTDWAICFHLPVASRRPGPNAPEYYCQPFSVHAPFFQYHANAAPRPDDPPPYVLKNTGTAANPVWVAIFGVVDPDLVGNVGRLNYGWLGKDKANETVVEVSDPAAALGQLLDRCGADPVCDKAQKVLLAQMPAFKANQLTATQPLGFDLVISQTDPARESGDLTIGKPLTSDKDARAADKKGPAVVTPGALYDPSTPEKLQVRLQSVRISTSRSAVALATTSANPADGAPCDFAITPPPVSGSAAGTLRILQNRKCDFSVPLPPSASTPAVAPTLRAAAADALAAIDPTFPARNSWTAQQLLQRLALLTMQSYLKTDMALLQERDLFQPALLGLTRINPANLQETLDRIFWKGDYAVSVPVTGATVKSILAQGKAFDKMDANSIPTDISQGKGLVPLGAFTEAATGNLMIGGFPEQDTNLYSVALTDYLALGDTGYPDLQKPAVPPPFRITDFARFYSIAGIVCAEISKHVGALNAAPCSPRNVPPPTAHPSDALVSKDYLDQSTQQPFDGTRGYTPIRQTRGWLLPSLHYHHQLDVYAGADNAEQAAQQKPRWSLIVEKADFGLNLNAHQALVKVAPGNYNTPAVAFSGNPLAQVTAPNSTMISFDNRTRLLRSARLVDWFAMDDLSYSETKTQGTCTNTAGVPSLPGCNYTKSQTPNTLTLEAGALPRIYPQSKLHPLRRQPADAKLLFSMRMDTQLDSPLEQVPISSPAPAAPTTPTTPPAQPATPAAPLSSFLNGQLSHTFTLMGKSGIRLEDERSWFEVGLENGVKLRTPYALQFGGKQICQLTYGQSTTLTAAAAAPSANFNDCVAYWSNPAAVPGSTNSIPTILPGATFKPLTVDRPAQGVFLNFSINFPLPIQMPVQQTISFVTENKGDLFFNRSGDLSTDTRYFDKWSNYLLVPAIGNLSVKPEVDVFFYENKVQGGRFHTVQAMLTLSYSFSWHQGLSWRKALLYANPAPLTSLPTGSR